MRAAIASATSAKGGASATIASVMPVNAWIANGMRTPGFTSVDHSSTTRPSSSRTMPASMTRSRAACPPVVSRSTQAMRPASAPSAAATVQLQERPVEIGPAVAEQPPGMAVAADLLEVEARRDDLLAVIVRLRDDRAGVVRDEGMPVEGDRDLLALLRADAVRGDERHDVRGRVALHRALPVVARIERGILRLGADRGRVQEDLGALERHRARGLREPLVPAHRDARRAEARRPDLEAGVARREVELLVVSGALRDVRLAVHAHDRAVRVDHHEAVEVGILRALEDGERQHDLQLLRDFRQALDRRMLGDGKRELEVLREVVLAEVGRLEQLLDQDDVRALLRGLADQALGIRDVGIAIPAAGHLRRGDGHLHDRSIQVVLSSVYLSIA